MRSFRTSIYPGIAKGLTYDERSPRNTGQLIDCFNFKVGDYGLVPYQPVVIPFTVDTLNAYGIDLAWPHPQLMKGKKRIFLADRTYIYYVDDSYDLYFLDIYDVDNPASELSVQPGNKWQLADFHDTWFLHNGLTTVFHSNKNVMLGETDKVWGTNNVRVQTGCAFRGRNWMGGFDPDYYWSADWKDFWDDWANRYQSDISFPMAGLDENSVSWSTIGGGDLLFLFHFFMANEGIISGSYGDTEPLIFEYLERNEAGTRHMPWPGKVLQMIPLGNAVMVYGEGGASALLPSGKAVGLKEFDEFNDGIVSAGGNENEQICIDNTGTLWRINRDLSVQRLGYKNHLSSLLGAEISISFDNNEGEFYICNGVEAFTLTSGGLTEHGQQVTSIINHGGTTLGMAVHEDDMDKTYRLETDNIDMGEVGHKTLSFVDIHSTISNTPFGATPTTMNVAASYRSDVRSEWKSTRTFPVNNYGNARIGITAPMFRLKISGEDFRDVKIEDVVIEYQIPDRRFRRGVNVAAIGGR